MNEVNLQVTRPSMLIKGNKSSTVSLVFPSSKLHFLLSIYFSIHPSEHPVYYLIFGFAHKQESQMRPLQLMSVTLVAGRATASLSAVVPFLTLTGNRKSLLSSYFFSCFSSSFFLSLLFTRYLLFFVLFHSALSATTSFDLNLAT